MPRKTLSRRILEPRRSVRLADSPPAPSLGREREDRSRALSSQNTLQDRLARASIKPLAKPPARRRRRDMEAILELGGPSGQQRQASGTSGDVESGREEIATPRRHASSILQNEKPRRADKGPLSTPEGRSSIVQRKLEGRRARAKAKLSLMRALGPNENGLPKEAILDFGCGDRI
jgi:hypothetical protein